MPHVLVIEDDPGTAKTIARALEHAGYGVSVARDGGEGVRLFEARRADLVITDILMPEMDGYEVIRSFRKRTPPVPVIVISGGGMWPGKTLLETAEHLGAIESVSKPFDLDDLMIAVERALGVRAGTSDAPKSGA